MRWIKAAFAAFFFFATCTTAFPATELRMLGGPGPLNDGDIYFGTAYWDSPGGRRVYFVNASMLPFSSDNTVVVEDLFVLAAATTGAPYASSGAWYIDDNATFMSRHWSGSGDFLKYDGTRGSAGGTGTTTAILKGDGAGGFDDAAAGTDYVAPAGNAATATALAANPSDCTGGMFAVGINANGTAVCDTPAGVGDMVKAHGYDVNTDNVVDVAAALSAQYIDWNQTTGPTSVANKPTLGTIVTQDADDVAITGGDIDNTTIGGTTPAHGSFLGMNVTGAADFQGIATLSSGVNIPDDTTIAVGTDNDVLCQFVSSTSQFKCSTANYGSTMTDADGMFTIQVNSGGGTLDDEQVVFSILDNNTSLFKVDQDGDVTMTGELTAAQIVSNCSPTDNTCGINVANDGNPGSPVEGLCYYNRSTNLFLCYNGATWESGAGGSIENEAFGSAWNGDTTNGAAKDNIYDWGHVFDTDDDGKVNVLDIGAGIVKTDSGGVVSAASAGTDYVSPSSSETLTNKTLSVDGTGNIITIRPPRDYTILNPVAADNSYLYKSQFASTIMVIHCIASGGGTITLQILECTSAGASCAGVDGATTITCDSDGATDDGSLSNAAIDAGDWVSVVYGAPSGTVNNLTFSIYSTEVQ